MSSSAPKSVADIQSFITLLMVACEEPAIHKQLDDILSMPDDRRKVLISQLVAHMRISHAPKDFIAAIACLEDTAVAEKAYEVIFQCKRKDKPSGFLKWLQSHPD